MRGSDTYAAAQAAVTALSNKVSFASDLGIICPSEAG